MIITQISVEDLLTTLTGISSPTDQTSTEKVSNIFGAILQSQNSPTDNGSSAKQSFDLNSLKGIKTTEISEQIKDALTSGGKIKLELNNPKDILATLITHSSKVNSNTPKETDKTIVNINLDQLLDSLVINEVVVDDQQVSIILDQFIEQLTSIFDQVLEVAKEKEIPNLEELTESIKLLQEEITTQIESLSITTNKEISIDLSKIKLIIPNSVVKESETDVEQVEAPISPLASPVQDIEAKIILVNNNSETSKSPEIIVISKEPLTQEQIKQIKAEIQTAIKESKVPVNEMEALVTEKEVPASETKAPISIIKAHSSEIKVHSSEPPAPLVEGKVPLTEKIAQETQKIELKPQQIQASVNE
ncbi:MAG: hypothetical protein AB1782_02930, partial [Cyanobacteriota bacterium]